DRARRRSLGRRFEGDDPRPVRPRLQLAEQDHRGRFRRLGRRARVEMDDDLGRTLQALVGMPRPRTASAARRIDVRAIRQGDVRLRGVRVLPPVARGGARGVSSVRKHYQFEETIKVNSYVVTIYSLRHLNVVTIYSSPT